MTNLILKKAGNFFSTLIDVVYPLRCLICRVKIEETSQGPLCRECFKKIVRNSPPFCIRCGIGLDSEELSPNRLCLNCRNNFFYFDKAFSVCKYEGIMRECIHMLKYERRLLLLNLFDQLLTEFIKAHIDIEEIDYLVPVPLHPTKLREREFNQSHLLCCVIARRFNKQISKRNLIRSKFTPPQTQLPPRERKSNIKDAFSVVAPALLEGKNILLLDDVFTTGSTVNECAKVLKNAGVRNVIVLTLAR